MEKIGYIKKNKISLQSGLNSIDVLINASIDYDDRDVVEFREDVIQPVCAGVIITKDNYVLTVCKNKNAAGKSLEKDKTLLYVGGHLDDSDSSETNLKTFMTAMKREVLEEICLKVNGNEILEPILTYTPVTDKSTKHFGVIFPVIIEKCFDVTFTDGKCKFVNIYDLKEIDNFEPWSEIILKEIIGKLIKLERQF